jgi:hypothetical protein
MPSRIGIAANIVCCVVLALALSSVMRPFTAELNRTVGRVWPFSTVHCRQAHELGCEALVVRRVLLARR